MVIEIMPAKKSVIPNFRKVTSLGTPKRRSLFSNIIRIVLDAKMSVENKFYRKSERAGLNRLGELSWNDPAIAPVILTVETLDD